MARLNDFISSVKKVGLIRTARYSVVITPPDNLVGGIIIDNFSMKQICIQCDTIQVPGLNYQTASNLTYGESREVPYTRLYDNINMTFYVDNNMNTKKFFDAWLFSIQDPVTRTFSYYEKYISDIDIYVEDINNNSTYAVKLHECYPKSVNSIQLDYASKDVMKLSINLAYKYWTPINNRIPDDVSQYYNAIPSAIERTVEQSIIQ